MQKLLEVETPTRPHSLSERVAILERQVDELRLALARLQAAQPEKPEKTKKQKGTLDEVLEFCTSIDLPASDAEWFFSKCEGNGWKNNGKPILDWKQTIRAWKISKYLPSLKTSTTYGNQKNIGSPPGALNAGRYGTRPGP